MAANEIALQFKQLIGGNGDVSQLAEAGVDTVDGRTRRQVPFQYRTRSVHPLSRIG
jgi:hypothetical protein